MLAFTLCCYAACFPPSDPLADLLYGLPSKEKAEAYSAIASRRMRQIAAIPNVHPYVEVQACLAAIVWGKLAMVRNTKLQVDIRIGLYEEMLRCLRGCGFPQPATEDDDGMGPQ
jgi:hypothetical protein